MWIQRTPEEILKWREATEKEARFHGRLLAGIVWVLISLGGAGGWVFLFSGGTGAVLDRETTGGGFWLRLPGFALASFPFAYWLFRREKRNELAKITRRTICPQCDTSGHGNTGAACQCGGSYVPVSAWKWIEK